MRGVFMRVAGYWLLVAGFHPPLVPLPSREGRLETKPWIYPKGVILSEGSSYVPSPLEGEGQGEGEVIQMPAKNDEERFEPQRAQSLPASGGKHKGFS